MNGHRAEPAVADAGVPKAELHCHIEGAAPVALALRQAHKYGVDIAAEVAGEHYRWHDFSSFLACYDAIAPLFRSPEDFADLAERYLTAIAAEGAVYSEIFISPDHARAAGLTPEAYAEGLAEGIARAERATGIVGRMIVVGVRHLGVEAVEAAARFAAAGSHRRITGFGMAGDERAGRPADFAAAFNIARDAGLGLTVHAGEFAGPQSVREALDALRPARIGHGVRAVEDRALVARIADSRVVLEVCPGSNIALGLYRDARAHPLPALIAAGCRVCLNSDDPPFFATSLGREYALARAEMGLDAAALSAITRTAIEGAFVDEDTRAALLARL